MLRAPACNAEPDVLPNNQALLLTLTPTLLHCCVSVACFAPAACRVAGLRASVVRVFVDNLCYTKL
jgi:hypothetical protein